MLVFVFFNVRIVDLNDRLCYSSINSPMRIMSLMLKEFTDAIIESSKGDDPLTVIMFLLEVMVMTRDSGDVSDYREVSSVCR